MFDLLICVCVLWWRSRALVSRSLYALIAPFAARTSFRSSLSVPRGCCCGIQRLCVSLDGVFDDSLAHETALNLESSISVLRNIPISSGASTATTPSRCPAVSRTPARHVEAAKPKAHNSRAEQIESDAGVDYTVQCGVCCVSVLCVLVCVLCVLPVLSAPRAEPVRSVDPCELFFVDPQRILHGSRVSLFFDCPLQFGLDHRNRARTEQTHARARISHSHVVLCVVCTIINIRI